jgi:hypothetical protein
MASPRCLGWRREEQESVSRPPSIQPPPRSHRYVGKGQTEHELWEVRFCTARRSLAAADFRVLFQDLEREFSARYNNWRVGSHPAHPLLSVTSSAEHLHDKIVCSGST